MQDATGLPASHFQDKEFNPETKWIVNKVHDWRCLRHPQIELIRKFNQLHSTQTHTHQEIAKCYKKYIYNIRIMEM